MIIDFERLKEENIKLADLQQAYTHSDLIQGTNEMIDLLMGMVRDVPDSCVTFLPEDPEAYDEFAATTEEVHMAWTLAHVIVHITASGEETAAQGAAMARGIPVTGRSRYEVPWQSVTTRDGLVKRLEESRRIRLAYLNAWPEKPHLDVVIDKVEAWGALNAIGVVLGGLNHDYQHLEQVKDIICQAEKALSEQQP